MTKKILAIIFFGVIFLSVAVCLTIGIVYGVSSGQNGQGEMEGLGMFKAFTIDSNVLAALISLVAVIYLVSHNGMEIPNWLHTLLLASATSLMITFVTVVVFLVPVRIANGIPWVSMYSDDMYFYHLLNPILSVVGLILTGPKKFSIGARFCAVIPVFVYSIVYGICVIIIKCWSDFYGFTFGGRYYYVPLVMLIMYAGGFLFASLLSLATGRKAKTNKD